VLPFQNMSGDPEQEYFADGMVEDIITALSRFKSLFVIARNSSFTYKGRAVDIKQVGRELGVRYVLEGSVRKAGSRVRITGQLIEVATNAHLWAERYERSLEDVFAVQDEITGNVVAAIALGLESAEITRSKLTRTERIDAYDWYLRALSEVDGTVAGFKKAIELSYRAIDADPDYALPHGLAACCYGLLLVSSAIDREKEEPEALRLADRALALGGDDAETLVHVALAIGNFRRDVERAMSLVAKALAINPNLARAWSLSGWQHLGRGMHVVAAERCGIALRLNPVDRQLVPASYIGIAKAHLFSRSFEDALKWSKKLAFEGYTKNRMSCWVLASTAAHMDDTTTAKQALAQLEEAAPGSSIARIQNYYKNEFRWGQERDVATLLEGLRKAGLPE
jgi:TolB-like protein